MTEEARAVGVEHAATVIAASKYVVALVGAGMSAESGVPTFRGPEGLWTKHGEPDLRDYERFREDPKRWWERRLNPAPEMAEFVASIASAVPNSGHFALKEMEDLGFLQAIITQNIDNLHQVAGSVAIIEIHGNRTKLRCTVCSMRWPADEFPIDQLPPSCTECGGIVKGDTVMFGEPIPPEVLDECVEQTWKCDCMLLIGTSAVVYPAAQFPLDVRRLGGKLIEINPERTPLSDLSEVVIRAPSGEALPLMMERLRG
ncbi:MAG: NAD-dependent deacylase [Dehalococcoidia bacterium]